MTEDKTQQPLGVVSDLNNELGFDDVILWHGAFSYYCGRATIAVSAFIDDLIKNWPKLSPKVRYLIERDLEREFAQDDEDRITQSRHKRLGHDCDRKEWEKVRRLWVDKI
jgi:hypothetical protein